MLSVAFLALLSLGRPRRIPSDDVTNVRPSRQIHDGGFMRAAHLIGVLSIPAWLIACNDKPVTPGADVADVCRRPCVERGS